jgi:hypothetical protein
MPTVNRRRDRVRDTDEDTMDEEKEERRPRRSRDEEPVSDRRTSRRVRDEDDDDIEEERARRDRRIARKERLLDIGDDDEPEEKPHSRRSRDDDDDEDDDRSSRRRSSSREKKSGVPEGVRGGWDGAEQTINSGGGGDVNWLKIGDHVELVRFLEEAPLTSFRQHWLDSAGDERKSRPYLCPGSKCPVCGQGDNPSAYYIFNVLHLSGGAFPEVKALQINTSAYKDLKEVFNDRKSGKPIIDEDFASVKKSGKGFQTRTKFTKVKDRDLEDDWDEIFEYFDLKDLDDIIDEAQDELYTIEEVSPKATPRRELEKLAKYLDEPDED